MSVDLQEKREAKLAPPKRWQNWWRAPRAGVVSTGKSVVAGEVLPGGIFYPSRDVAVTKARAALALAGAKIKSSGEGDPLEHVGAFPEGQKPEGAV